MPEPNELLLVDWDHLDKGLMTATYDPERLSEEGKASESGGGPREQHRWPGRYLQAGVPDRRRRRARLGLDPGGGPSRTDPAVIEFALTRAKKTLGVLLNA